MMTLLTPTAAHVDQVRSLMRATFTETFGHLYPPSDLAHYLDTSYAAEQIRAELSDPRNFWQLVLDEAGAPVAYLECVPAHLPHPDVRPDEHGEIERIYVLRSQQGKGVGRQLMAAALRHLGERYGNAPQWLGVWSENLRAQALYKSYCFEKIGEYIFPVGETEDHEFILRRLP
jgi:diamine N-acetyltransferase